MNITIKKNILDLNYNKYLQYQITAIIISLTYVFGVIIGIFAKQIVLTDAPDFAIVTITSGFVLLPCAYAIYLSSRRLRKIPKLIMSL